MLEEDHNRCSKFDFQDSTGYILKHPQGLIAIGHTASIAPWSDPSIHLHTGSEEYYFLLKGKLEFIIRDFQLTLYPTEILMVSRSVPHAVTGGFGTMEHFGIRAPALDDKQVVSEIKSDLPYLYEGQRLISGDWGHRIPLEFPKHKNRWLIGAGSALYPSQYLIMAYLDFPTQAEANAGIGTRHQLHLHQKSWEYYVVLKGEKDLLLIDDTVIAVHAGEILEIPPNVNHALYNRRAPYLGFTMRVPVELNDKVIAKL
jgi:mannose-6-phosphate isomerase-like protein (cupin superfamily)